MWCDVMWCDVIALHVIAVNNISRELNNFMFIKVAYIELPLSVFLVGNVL